MYSSAIIIDQTDKFIVTSYGNGAAYELTAKDVPGYRSTFLQGDDATIWRAQYDAMQSAAVCEESVWFERTWDECLAELILEYLPE